MKEETTTFYNIEKDKSEPYTRVERLEQITVKDVDKLLIQAIYWRDPAGEEWLNPADPLENVRASFTEYRKIKHYLQPDEIRQIRQLLGLSLNKFARSLGMGPSTLSQIENNLKLQNREQDVLFKSIRNEYKATGTVQSLWVDMDSYSNGLAGDTGKLQMTHLTGKYDSGELVGPKFKQFPLANSEEVLVS